ncbi:type II toxin-antitoxin system VapC family toxin [Sphingomonas sp.]|uniref:type II toxin-antitoxin system VapC family toxin n=1 Tax=Sphingomonas sp. TaxID=28214 RepID=UPI003342B45D
MTVFLDASAIVAMIAREPEATSFAEAMLGEANRITSPLAIWEAARGVESARGVALAEARAPVLDFVEASALQVISVDTDDTLCALDAHERFGKGVHPAKLNFGDCFAYAVARRHDAALLFKGDDFAQIDIKDATLI